MASGKVVKTALVGLEIDFDENAIPKVELGINGTPRLIFLDVVEDVYGRHIPQRRVVGPDTTGEVTWIVKLYTKMSLAWQAKLDAE